MSQVMGVPVDVLLAGLAQNPGYPGLLPPDHCATALVYCLAHAEEYNSQVADPFDPLQRFGVINVPKLEAGNLRAMDVAGAVSQDIKYYLQGLTDLNHDLEKRIEVRTHELELERARSESLLLNILPQEIAQTLKERSGTIAQRFDQASVLFADMVGFTPLSAEMTPEEMVELLNTIYSFYDSLTEKYGLEKIRTIGDNYMVASGVPRVRPDHAKALARMALEMCDIFKDAGRLPIDGLNFRIGINSGPLVAGVIGYKKFQYDIWGPTVNTASRMESQGLPGKVQITQATYELLKDEFVCEPRGTLEVKGVGEVETWFLVGEEGTS
jgi:class 3 adenylate cyclase